MKLLDLHRRPKPPWIYIGRAIFLPKEGKRLPESVLANPLKLHGKDQAEIAANLAEFRRNLFEKIEANDPRIMALMRQITDDTALCCWCCELEGDAIFTEPERCHGQIVFKAWRYLKEQGRI